MHKLTFYVPKSHLDPVKKALFAKGAGKYDKYDSCSFETLGIGQFRPLNGSNPFIGSPGKIEKVEEYRVEMIVKDEMIKEVVQALLAAHPYEQPAYDLIPITHLV